MIISDNKKGAAKPIVIAIALLALILAISSITIVNLDNSITGALIYEANEQSDAASSADKNLMTGMADAKDTHPDNTIYWKDDGKAYMNVKGVPQEIPWMKNANPAIRTEIGTQTVTLGSGTDY